MKVEARKLVFFKVSVDMFYHNVRHSELVRAHISFHHHLELRQSFPPRWHTTILHVLVCRGFESYYSILMTICQVNSAMWLSVWVHAHVWVSKIITLSEIYPDSMGGQHIAAGGWQSEQGHSQNWMLKSWCWSPERGWDNWNVNIETWKKALF